MLITCKIVRFSDGRVMRGCGRVFNSEPQKCVEFDIHTTPVGRFFGGGHSMRYTGYHCPDCNQFIETDCKRIDDPDC